MAESLVLGYGERRLLPTPVARWDVEFSDTIPPSVVLTASMRAGPNPPISQKLGGAATTLAIQMSTGVAMMLPAAARRVRPLHGLTAAIIRRIPRVSVFQRKFGTRSIDLTGLSAHILLTP
jgi:hypothetical protein